MQICFPGDRPALDLQGERRAFQLEALGQPARLGIEHDPHARRKERRELACVFLSARHEGYDLLLETVLAEVSHQLPTRGASR